MNWWLMALAFALGLILTLAFMIRRVERVVPPATPEVAQPDPTPEAQSEWAERADESAEPEDAVEPEEPSGPHGPGSAKPGAGGGGPVGWPVKGNEESKLYHSPESPSFGVTRAEVWFRDVATAEAAGFNRWDSGKSQRGQKPT